MEAKIVSFRLGGHTQRTNQMIVKVSGIDTREKANPLINKNVTWQSITGKIIKGKITKIHGNGGALIVTFERGLPGQAITNKIKVE